MLHSHGFTLKLVVIIFATIGLALALNLTLATPIQATPEYGVLTVGNDTDTSGLTCNISANCNLRSAIEYANTHGGDYAIIFTPGVHTFTLGSPLVISANAISITANAGVTVFVNANNHQNAFQISGSDVTVNNLNIYGSGSGYSNIWINGSAQRIILSNNAIGGYRTSEGSIQCDLSPNSYSGVYINSTGAIAPGSARAWIFANQIACNKGDPGDGLNILTDHVIVGTDQAGAVRGNATNSNKQNGITISGSAATDNIIRNAVSSGNRNGIVITNTAHSNQVLTNSIGINTNLGVWVSGGAYYNVVQANNIYGQANTGVQLDDGAHDNEIGSHFLSSGNGNLIFNNAREGIYISGADTRYNAIRDNRIGVDGRNGQNGVVLTHNAHGNVVGDILIPGGVPTGRNFISGNGFNGIEISWSAYDNTVGGNYIGTDVLGASVLSNTWSGVAILSSAHDNTIDQNLIGGNGVYGVVIDDDTTSTNTLTLNQIGYSLSTLNALPNVGDGVILSNGTFGNIIGGAGLGNVIGGNTQSGIYVVGGSHHNSIRDNAITSNLKYGILFDGAATAENVISDTAIYVNGLDGIAERNGAYRNIWTHISTYDNRWLGINTQAVNEETHTPHPPALLIVSLDRSTGVITGKANNTTGLFITQVELYRVAPDASGYGEGRAFVGSTFTDSFGNWSITDPAFTGCYVAFTTETSLLGTGSTEFSRNNCGVFLPLIVKSP